MIEISADYATKSVNIATLTGSADEVILEAMLIVNSLYHAMKLAGPTAANIFREQVVFDSFCWEELSNECRMEGEVIEIRKPE